MILSVLTVIYFINAIIAGITILLKPRDVAIWAWLLVLIALPVLVFLIFILWARFNRQKKFYLQQSDLRELENFQNFQEESFELYSQKMPTEEQQQLQTFSSLNRMPLTKKNDVEIFTDGTEKFNALMADIKSSALHSY